MSRNGNDVSDGMCVIQADPLALAYIDFHKHSLCVKNTARVQLFRKSFETKNDLNF